MTKDTPTSLYLVHHEHGFYKIGVSVHPERRLYHLQISSPYKLTLTLTIPSTHTDAYRMERHLHETFYSRQVTGEWYKLDLKHVVALHAYEKHYRTNKISFMRFLTHHHLPTVSATQPMIRWATEEPDDFTAEGNGTVSWRDLNRPDAFRGLKYFG